jgi:hypothetical protein
MGGERGGREKCLKKYNLEKVVLSKARHSFVSRNRRTAPTLKVGAGFPKYTLAWLMDRVRTKKVQKL